MAEVSGVTAVGATVVGATEVGVMEVGDLGADGVEGGGREFMAASTADTRPMVMAAPAPTATGGPTAGAVFPIMATAMDMVRRR